MGNLVSKISVLAAVMAGASIASLAGLANASTYNFNENIGGHTLDLTFTTSGSAGTVFGQADAELISGVSGTVDGVAVSNFTGLWGPPSPPGPNLGNHYAVNNGLYTDAGAPTPTTLHGVWGTGGADYVIDNVWFPSIPTHFDYDNGVAFLLINGASDYIWGNCNGCENSAGYSLYAGATPPDLAPPPAATPLPAALPLFTTGLGVMGLLGWRRKRKGAAAIAA